MADTQLVSSPTKAAPKDYTVPGSAAFILKAVQATFTDNGAASDWLPALDLISDSGHRIARCVDTGVKVTAGNDASVSWFPGVKPATPFTPNTGGVWVPYTPVWTETSGTQPSLGNGALTGLYYQIGTFVVCQVKLVAGSTTTFGNSSGVWAFSLPVTAATASVSFGMSSNGVHAGNDNVISWGFQNSTTTMAGWGYDNLGTILQFINSAQPVTWQSGDTLRLACMYEAA